MPRYHKREGHRDLNEKDIIRALTQMGASVYKTLPVDLIVLHGNRAYFAEVKNPETKWRYNQEEEDFAWDCEAHDIEMWTLETPEDALQMLGLIDTPANVMAELRETIGHHFDEITDVDAYVRSVRGEESHNGPEDTD